MIIISSNARKKESIVYHNNGFPFSKRNCFGIILPIRVPLPPATITAYFFMCAKKMIFLEMYGSRLPDLWQLRCVTLRRSPLDTSTFLLIIEQYVQPFLHVNRLILDHCHFKR